MRSRFFLILNLFIILSIILPLHSATQAKKITLEEFYKVRSYFGKSAKGLNFSEDGDYLAFLWNSYNEFGYDLYIYDMKGANMIRVTALDLMRKFNTPEDHEKFIKKGKEKREEEKIALRKFYAQRDYLMGKQVDLSRFEKEEIKKLKAELKKKELEKKKEESLKKKEKGEIDKKKGDKKDKKKGVDDLEMWELRDKLKEWKDENKVERKDLYPGVSRYSWSKTSNDIIFEYRGDLFFYSIDKGEIRRLTMTDASERLVSFTSSGDGYYYLSGNKLYLVKFNSSYIHQLNHRLEKAKKKKDKSFKIEDTVISPDGKWMVIIGAKKEKKGGTKDVVVVNYKKRFADPVKIKRQMTDTKRSEPVYRFWLREVKDLNYGKQPEHIFEIPGGDIWYETSSILWSEDSRYFAFMSWEREKGDLKIWLGDMKGSRKPEQLFTMKETIGYKSSFWNNIKFTPDSKKLVSYLNNKDGFRQLCYFDLPSGKKKEITKGKFESFPVVGFSKDSKYLYTLSSKQDTAYLSLYKVKISNGKMEIVGNPDGVHSSDAVSKDGEWYASNYMNWSNPKELYLKNLKTGKTRVLTSSHNSDWNRLNFLKPELFKFKNRHGDSIRGMMWKPPGWKKEDMRPGIVLVYGGPLGRAHSVMSHRFSTYSYMFQMIMAAKHGFVTINIDPRGQSGYGRKFNEANFKDPGKAQTEDLEDLMKEIGKGGFGVDTSRVGLHGWSFGGYQTLYTMFNSPDTFACGISAAPPTQWENYNSWYTGATIGDSKRDKMNIRKYSLIPMAKNLKNPLLLVHGMMDYNVLYQDTVNVYRALLESGKETLVDLFLDPEGGHGLGGAIKNKGTYKKFESWFIDKLKKGQSWKKPIPVEDNTDK
ncbi:MAG: S9 family peptidase [Candidatus Aminicenantes bacterium]|nr:S9 family peptidase [Candidatus Aminicenantes bacterium]